MHARNGTLKGSDYAPSAHRIAKCCLWNYS